MQPNPFSSDVGARVLVAFLGENAHWRTLGGIVRDSGLNKSDVTRFLEDNKECFVESTIRLGGNVLCGIRHDLRQHALAGAPPQRPHRATG